MDPSQTNEPDLVSKEQLDPLDLINKHFQDVYAKTDLTFKKSLENKRLLSTNKLPVMKFEEVKMVSAKIQLNSATAGFPTCVTSSKHMILVGTNSGNLSVFGHDGSEIKVLKQKNFGSVTCVDVSDDEQWAAAGYFGGQVSLWDLRSGNCVKSSGNLFSQPIVSCRFWKHNKNNIIAADLTGKVSTIEYGKSFLTTNINSNTVLTGEAGQVISIQPLFSDSNWPHPTDSSSVVVMACVDRILLFLLEPDFTILMGIERPEEVEEGFLPDISVKMASGPGEDQPIDPILSIAWGRHIFLYKIKSASPEGIQQIGSYEMDAEIKSIHLLSHDLISVVINTRDVIILSTKGFIGKQEAKNPVLEEIFVTRDIAVQAFIKDSNKKEKNTYHNTISCFDSNVFILGNKQLHKGRVINWKECVLELSKNGDWITALCVGMDFYQGKGCKAYNLPHSKSEFKETFEQVIEQYVKAPNISWDFKISNTIEFCVGIESTDFLFNFFFDYFIDEGDGRENLKMFIDIIEPFVIHEEITTIPTVNLGKILSFYLANKKSLMVEKLVLHLNYNCLDPAFIYPVCEEYELTLAHIYVSIWNLQVEKSMIFLNNLLKKSGDKFIAYQLLWYLRLCIKGQKFPKSFIRTEDWAKILVQVLISLTEGDLLENLINMDANTTLKVIWIYFQDLQPSQVLNTNKSVSITKLISKLESVCLNDSFHYFAIFLAKLCQKYPTKSNEIKKSEVKYSDFVSKPLAIKILTHLMKPYHDLENIKSVDPPTIQTYIQLNQNSNKTMTEFDYQLEQKSSLLLEIIKNFENFSNSELEDLYKIAVNSAYTEVLVYLLELKQDYAKCFITFLQCSSVQAQLKVFDWLNRSLNTLTGESLDSLKSQVIESLNFLVDIDSDKTAKIVRDWFHNEQLLIVHKLDNAPKLQMKYLGELLKSPGKEVIEEKLIILFIKLLCEYNQGQVLQFLKSREDYSLDECLAVCLSYSIIEASAYLYERLGAIKNALDLHLSMIESKKKEIQKGLKNYERLIYSEILQEISSSVALCVRNSGRLDENEIEDHWFCLLGRTLETYIDLAPSFATHIELESCIQSGIKQTIEHMIDSVDILRIISFIVQRFGNIPFKYFKANFIGVLSRFSYQKTIIKKAIDLLCSDIKYMTQQLLVLKSKGVSSKRFCCFSCSQPIVSDDLLKNKGEKFVLFICGHVYHSRCIKKKICEVCTRNEQKQGALLQRPN